MSETADGKEDRNCSVFATEKGTSTRERPDFAQFVNNYN